MMDDKNTVLTTAIEAGSLLFPELGTLTQRSTLYFEKVGLVYAPTQRRHPFMVLSQYMTRNAILVTSSNENLLKRALPKDLTGTRLTSSEEASLHSISDTPFMQADERHGLLFMPEYYDYNRVIPEYIFTRHREGSYFYNNPQNDSKPKATDVRYITNSTMEIFLLKLDECIVSKQHQLSHKDPGMSTKLGVAHENLMQQISQFR